MNYVHCSLNILNSNINIFLRINIIWGLEKIIVLNDEKCVPRKGFGCVCDAMHTIYLSLCIQTADPNPYIMYVFAYYYRYSISIYYPVIR